MGVRSPVAVLAALILLGSAGCSIPSRPAYVSSDVPAATSSAKAGPAVVVDDGTYEVGADMAAGRYKTPGPPADAAFRNCYWARLRSDSGQFEAIIANGNSQGPASVTIKAGEFFETNGGCTWTKQG